MKYLVFMAGWFAFGLSILATIFLSLMWVVS